MKIFTYKKKACFQISDEMDIFINETISKWQTKLKMNNCIQWTSDFDFFNKIHEMFLGGPDTKQTVAGAMSGINLIRINKMAHQFSFKELEKSIVHELLHMKYPNKSETWILKKTNGVLK